jgi:hypothetical protein
MSMNPRAIATARRNLAQRIARFIDAVEKEGREPNRVEGDYALSALGHLAVDQWPDGELAMLKAERAATATPQEIAMVRAAYDPVTVKHLRSELAKVMENKS